MTRTGNREDDLLIAFLEGHPGARDILPRRLHGRLAAIARSIAPDLADRGLDEDVVQRMWELLLHKEPGSFTPERGNAVAYLGALLRNAAIDVRAEHTPPGERTRLYRKPTKRERRAYMRKLLHDYDRAEMSERSGAWNGAPDPHDDIEAVEARLTAMEILALARYTGAPTHVIRAMAMIHDSDVLLGEAARAVGRSRFALRRDIKAWVQHQLRELARLTGRDLSPGETDNTPDTAA